MRTRMMWCASAVLVIGSIATPGAATGSPATAKSVLTSKYAAVFFDPGRATLTASARNVLDDVASEYGSGWNLVVAGYVQANVDHSNDRALSAARARVVRGYLLQAGVTGDVAILAGGVRPTHSRDASARLALVTWSAVPVPTPTPTPEPTPSPTPTPTTCSLTYDAQGGVLADASAQTVTAGATMILRNLRYGPGSFNGWYTTPFVGYNDSKAGFIGYGLQPIAVPCAAGTSMTLYAHWAAPEHAVAQAATIAVGLNGWEAGILTITGCANDCPIETQTMEATLTSEGGGPITFTLRSGYNDWVFNYGDEFDEVSMDILWNSQVGDARTITTARGVFVRTKVDESTFTIVWTPAAGATGTDRLWLTANP